MQNQIKYIITLAFLVVASNGFSQERETDTIDTDVVNVVKPYTPTISDAFKIKETPTLNDSTTAQKKDVKYNIFSIPVASTFTPAKGKAATVDKAKPIKLYDNYASLGFGTYTTILGEVYLNHALNRTERVGGYLSHHSSQGGIDGLLLDDNFSNTNLNANFSKQLRDMSWTVDAGFGLQTYNWYGLPQPLFDETTADMINEGHSFYNVHFGGKLNFEDAIIDNLKVRFRRFGDDQDSGENRFVASSEFTVPIRGEEIKTEVTIDYIGGEFDRNFYTEDAIKYGNINFGIAPSYQLKQDDLTVNLGVNLVYLNDTEFSDNKFYIYPNISASYRLVDEILIAYGGIEGGLIQNSYYDFANENPFVSPTLFIAPTDQQYNASVGLKGKLSNSMSYNISGRYFADRNKAMFMSNSVLGGATEDYQYGNSYGIVYDDVNTLSVAGELNVDINRNFNLGIKAEYFNYSTDAQSEAWNLPDIKGSLFLDYQIDDNWFAGAGLFFVGERKDLFYEEGTLVPTSPVTVTLDSYFDANAHVGYRVTDRLSVFVKANNIANNDYQRWMNFPVQGIQVLGGATYQFDF
ncbi:TonB-dependent receptor [Meridianimaribacter sp. CL38]|uniref:TonB-dependent receptor n=1 Tax=Meridianimaribacter sp. CL38 TaxID=2213021 RepID=UPI00103A5CCE|nr:TonB-dependent receptor [Meridianimaribacter sp. CL38]TBV27601.1 TonB-dependent receptor [Meridianimaribacter sp. CL38]